MTGARKRWLPTSVLALSLHTGLLCWQFAEPPTTLPTALSSQRVVVSLGARPVARKPPAKPKQNQQPVEKKVSPPTKPVPKVPKQSQVKKPAVLPVSKQSPVARKTLRKKAQPQAKPEPQKTVPSHEEQNVVQPSPLPKAKAAEEQSDQPTPAASRVVQEATPLYQINPPPKYPRRARRRGLEGIVLLEALIDISGRVADLRLFTSSGHPVLDRAALKAVSNWRFSPGTIGDKRKEMWAKVPIRFRLQ